jgi:hypothetical protein
MGFTPTSDLELQIETAKSKLLPAQLTDGNGVLEHER